jgi:HK97 family phage major capsid protein
MGNMANLISLKRQHADALAKSDKILRAAEDAHRELTPAETAELDICTTALNALGPQISAIARKATVLQKFPNGSVLVNGNSHRLQREGPKVLSDDYSDGFYDYIASGGKQISAAMYEGSAGAGGYAVPIVVDDQIVPLAPQEMAVRQLAQVIPTASDIKVPIKQSFGQATLKAETAAFAENDPTLGQFTLTAYLIGSQETCSWELAQDVPAFQSFMVDDMVLAQQMREEAYYVTGTGSGQPQGLIGNVGAGVMEEPDTSGNLISISGTLDLLGTLNEVYHQNASFLMTRASSIIIRKAQVQANLFEPVWTRVGKQDFLHGYPVAFSAYMPTAARGACPVLFGDFKRGFVIGDRGGSGINVKVLDQPAAQQGEIILLAYRRTDSRVRRSEAIQSYNISAS